MKKEPRTGLKPQVKWIFLAVYLVFSILLFDPKLFTGGDNATYIILAESLASGRGYANIHLPGSPGHTQYPPGFPILLAPFVLLFGANIIVLKILILLTGIGAMFFAYKLSAVIFKENSTHLLVLLLSLPVLITYNHWILSEMPFLFFSLGAVYFASRLRERSSLVWTLAAVGCAVFSFFIRTSGISLVAALALYFFLKKDYRPLVILAVVFLAAFVPWQVRNAHIPSEGSYLDQLLAKNPYQMDLGRASVPDMIGRVAENFVLYFFNIVPAAILSAVSAAGLKVLTGIILTGLAIAGLVRRFKTPTIGEWYFVFGLAVLLLWPAVWSSDRFFLPLLPFFLIYFFDAVFWLTGKTGLRYLPAAVTGVMVAVNIFSLAPEMRASAADAADYLRGDPYAGYTPDWRRYFESVEWIRKNIPEDKVVMARKTEFVYLLSRHRSLIYPFTENRDKVRQAVNQCDYILLDNFYWTQTTRRYLLPVLQLEPERYEIAHQTHKPEFYVLKIKR